ncbi:hypothetical protein ACIBCD_41235 [Nocardia brasiliensis]|uniref:hypothetical protein n=1 Tax=Nocardia brasiliensis TaxID=37326 RepID=UPI003787D0F4
MGDIRPHTQAELEQIERDQQDPKWLEWLAPENMNAQLDAFLNETVQEMPDDPWSAQGLDRLERLILDRSSEMDDVNRVEDWAVADQCSRYLGEVFRRNFEGAWFNVPTFGGVRYPSFGPAIRHKWTGAYSDTVNLITAAVHRRWGNYLSGIFSNKVKTYQAWVEAGRPPRGEWVKK